MSMKTEYETKVIDDRRNQVYGRLVTVTARMVVDLTPIDTSSFGSSTNKRDMTPKVSPKDLGFDNG